MASGSERDIIVLIGAVDNQRKTSRASKTVGYRRSLRRWRWIGQRLFVTHRVRNLPLQERRPGTYPTIFDALTSIGWLLYRPGHRRVDGRDGADPLVDELLQALAGVSLGRVDVPLGVRGDAVHTEEHAGLPTAIAEIIEHFHCLAGEHPDVLVDAVSDVEIFLLRVL